MVVLEAGDEFHFTGGVDFDFAADGVDALEDKGVDSGEHFPSPVSGVVVGWGGEEGKRIFLGGWRKG